MAALSVDSSRFHRNNHPILNMPVSLTVIKRLFAKSGNKCAFNWCQSPLIVGDLVLAEICHIRARRKGGPRYDPTLTAEERDAFRNLMLLCPTHHTEADKNSAKFTAELLSDIKEMNERGGDSEITPLIAEHAARIHAKQFEKSKRAIESSPVHGGAPATASHGSVAVSVAGHNQGNINIRVGGKGGEPKAKHPANSIGADANLTGYIEYLCDLYVKFMSPIEKNEKALWGRLGKHIKGKFRLRKRSRNDLPAEKFDALVDYLIYEKLAKTPVGQKHLRNGQRLCSTFDEWRALR